MSVESLVVVFLPLILPPALAYFRSRR